MDFEKKQRPCPRPSHCSPMFVVAPKVSPKFPRCPTMLTLVIPLTVSCQCLLVSCQCLPVPSTQYPIPSCSQSFPKVSPKFPRCPTMFVTPTQCCPNPVPMFPSSPRSSKTAPVINNPCQPLSTLVSAFPNVANVTHVCQF